MRYVHKSIIDTAPVWADTVQAGQAVMGPGPARPVAGVPGTFAGPPGTEAAGLAHGNRAPESVAGVAAGNQRMGNRAFMRWVGELHARGQDADGQAGAARAGRARQGACPDMRAGPLQRMPKKKNQPGAPALEAGSGEAGDAGAAPHGEAPERVAVAPGATGTLPQPGPGSGVTRSGGQAGESGLPGQGKKKKKSRVQVALNTLRSAGVESFRAYLEAQIGETELLRTLLKRITQADDFGDVRVEALRIVQGRLEALDPAAGAEAPGAVAPARGRVPEVAVVAPARSDLTLAEVMLLNHCIRGEVRKLSRHLRLRNVDINIYNGVGTPLCTAAYYGHPGIARELLSRPGIDVNLAQQPAATPLYLAAQQGHPEVVKVLLCARGIKVNLASSSKTTPLYIAVQRERTEVIKLLLGARGIDVNAVASNGTNALMFAAQSGNEDVVRLLLEAPDIDLDVRKDDGASALLIAAQSGFTGIVERLVRRGADANLALHTGETPLCVTADSGCLDVVRTLLQAPGIQVDQTTHDGVMPLGVAAQMGHKEIVRLLLRKGADPNIAQEDGFSPLHSACLQGHAAVVRMLLHAGANMDAEMGYKKRYTSSDLAGLANHREVVSILAAHRRRTAHNPVQAKPSLALLEAVPFPAAGAGRRVGQPLPPSPQETGKQAERNPEPAGSRDTGGTVAADRAPDQALSPGMAGEVVPPVPPTPLAQARDALRQVVLGKLRADNLEPHEGIRLLEDVNDAGSLDSLCVLYNRLAHIERQKERARRRGARRGRSSVSMATPAPTPERTDPRYSLDARTDLDVEAVEGEIKGHLEQQYHRFVSQAVNDMEFGRGKPTSGYPGLWHASAGVAGVGSCSVFYYTDGTGKRHRIVGIGHHVDRGAYRLVYSAEDLGRPGQVLRLV